MRNITSRFLIEKKRQPALGLYICLARAVAGQRFGKYVLSKKMKELLIEGDDYQKSDRKALLDHLDQLSQGAMGAKIESNSAIEASSIMEDEVLGVEGFVDNFYDEILQNEKPIERDWDEPY